MVNIIVCGINGRMGKAIEELCLHDDSVEIVAGIDIIDDSTLGFPVFGNYDEVDVKADVIIDFSHISVLDSLLDFAIKNNVAVRCLCRFSATFVYKTNGIIYFKQLYEDEKWKTTSR